eukprot:SAG31_NODE_1216_length_9328_cov_12.252465_5_plen_121_part_00
MGTWRGYLCACARRACVIRRIDFSRLRVDRRARASHRDRDRRAVYMRSLITRAAYARAVRRVRLYYLNLSRRARIVQTRLYLWIPRARRARSSTARRAALLVADWERRARHIGRLLEVAP